MNHALRRADDKRLRKHVGVRAAGGIADPHRMRGTARRNSADADDGIALRRVNLGLMRRLRIQRSVRLTGNQPCDKTRKMRIAITQYDAISAGPFARVKSGLEVAVPAGRLRLRQRRPGQECKNGGDQNSGSHSVSHFLA